MNRIIAYLVVLLSLSACSAPQVTVGIQNPASVYCEQEGNKHEIQTAADGSQSGICIFPDGSSCDEWAYYREECGPTTPQSPAHALTMEATKDTSNGVKEEQASGGYMPPGTTEEIADWWGIIKSTEAGAQFDDYFERQDLGGMVYFRIDSTDPEVKSQIEKLRNSGKIVHLYGTLLSNMPDYNGSQILVDRIEIIEKTSTIMSPLSQYCKSV